MRRVVLPGRIYLHHKSDVCVGKQLHLSFDVSLLLWQQRQNKLNQDIIFLWALRGFSTQRMLLLVQYMCKATNTVYVAKGFKRNVCVW